MSVLIQRPHQVPGIINLPRQHSAPRRQPQPSYSHQPTVSATAPILSPKANRRPRGDKQSSSSANNSNQASAPKTSKDTKQHRRANNNSSAQAAHPQTNPLPVPAPVTEPLSLSSGNSPSATVSPSQSQSHSDSSSASSVLSSTSAASNPSPSNENSATTIAHKRSSVPHPPPSPPSANGLPVPANRRRARSPRPTAKLPPTLSDHDDDSDVALRQGGATPAKRGRRTNAPAQIPLPTSPATWQQAALIKKKPSSSSPHPSGVLTTGSLTPAAVEVADLAAATPVKRTTGSSSTPASPAVRHSPPAFVQLPHSPTMPNFHTRAVTARAGGHTRAPSVPITTTATINNAGRLDALFSKAMVLPSAPVTPDNTSAKKMHGRGASVSSSLPPVSSLHAKMAAAGIIAPASAPRPRRERALTGNDHIKFASASFQTAPDAMVLPKPMFRLNGFSSSEDESNEDASSSSDFDDEGLFLM